MQAVRESAQRLDNCWFVIERSASIQSTPLARHVLNEPVVLVRTADGQILALADRCPHQGVPLSHGRLSAKGLMCRYHGWSFDQRGHCTFIPGAPADAVADIRVQSYRIQELDGQVWISRSATAALPQCVVETRATAPLIFLWEKNFLHPATRLHTQLNAAGQSEGSVVQIAVSVLGCAARISVCITPETLGTSRVFAGARLESRWLPGWLVERLVVPRLRRRFAGLMGQFCP
jgi:nitrite reductase/ring-hydroxylating ferredoxin subunit